MAASVAISPLIKTARWGLLGLGLLYGYKHNETLKVKRAKERVSEVAIRDQYIKDKMETQERERLEFEKDSILFQK